MARCIVLFESMLVTASGHVFLGRVERLTRKNSSMSQLM